MRELSEPSYREVQLHDGLYKTSFIKEIETTCAMHAEDGRAPGVFAQFKTDWTVDGLDYALRQTLTKYQGFGYKDRNVFYELGAVIGNMLRVISESKN